jgi:hypothetical protein
MLERALIGSRHEVQARLRLQSAIDQALDIRSVARREVRGFIEQLDGVLAEVDALGEAHASEALQVAWYFVDQIPKVFNDVEDESEVGQFCTELIEMLIKLSRAAGAEMGQTARRIVDIYLDDSKEFCKFGGAEAILVRAGLDEAATKKVVDRLTARAKEFDDYGRAGVRALKKKLTGGSALGRRPPVPGRMGR